MSHQRDSSPLAYFLISDFAHISHSSECPLPELCYFSSKTTSSLLFPEISFFLREAISLQRNFIPHLVFYILFCRHGTKEVKTLKNSLENRQEKDVILLRSLIKVGTMRKNEKI